MDGKEQLNKGSKKRSGTGPEPGHSVSKQPISKRPKTNSGQPDSVGAATGASLVSGTGSKFFHGVNAYILAAGIGKVRTDLFKKQIKNNGGNVYDTFCEGGTASPITHIIVDEKMEADRLCRIMKFKVPPKCINVLKSLWVSKCLKEKTLVPIEGFLLDISSFSSDDESNQKETAHDDGVKTADGTKVDIPKSKTDPKSHSSNLDQNEGCKVDHNLSDSDSETEPRKPKIAKHGFMFGSYKKPAIETTSNNDSEADSDYIASGDEEAEKRDPEEGTSKEVEVPGRRRPLPKGNWVCAQASSVQKINHNKHITEKLEALAKVYENTNDRWRALGYAKAISALKRHHKTITTFEEAKALPGVGERLANKIWEIIESGELRKLNELSSSEELKSLDLFKNIWGVGATTARVWVQQGLRTLEDVREKAQLNRVQTIGLAHYDDLLDRMPREEAGEIETVVKEAALSINAGLTVMACGSYRRGKPTCGDVDVLITHPDGKSHKGIFAKVLQKLHESGFLTDDLVSQEDSGSQKKYMGVCLLPGENRKHRRLDIIIVPYEEFACALMYFTGSAHFNRSMRNLAGKMGMSLSEHSLNVGVARRRGEKLNAGTPVSTPTEESVFKHLGLPYRPPNERDH